MMELVARYKDERPARLPLSSSSGSGLEWQPQVSIHEDGDKFIVEAMMPGIDPNNIVIRIHNGCLTLTGGKDRSSRSRLRALRNKEARRFERRIQLPDDVDSLRFETEHHAHTLTIRFHKRCSSDIIDLRDSPTAN